MGGFIKLYREMRMWEHYTSPVTKAVFIDLLLRANWETVNWKGLVLYPGQLFCSVQKLAADNGLTYKQCRRALEKLAETGEIYSETRKNGRLITLQQYARYQGTDRAHDWASEGQPDGQPSGKPSAPQNAQKTGNTANPGKQGGKPSGKPSGKQMGKPSGTSWRREEGKNKRSFLEKSFLSQSEMGQMADLWEQFLNHLEAKNTPFERRIQELACFNVLRQYSGDDAAKAERIVQKAIAGNHKDFVPLHPQETLASEGLPDDQKWAYCCRFRDQHKLEKALESYSLDHLYRAVKSGYTIKITGGITP